MISIFVVNRQEMSGLFIKLSSTLGANQAVDLERAFPIITPRSLGVFQFSEGFFNGLVISRLLSRSLVMNAVGFVLHKRFSPHASPLPCLRRSGFAQASPWEGGKGGEQLMVLVP